MIRNTAAIPLMGGGDNRYLTTYLSLVARRKHAIKAICDTLAVELKWKGLLSWAVRWMRGGMREKAKTATKIETTGHRGESFPAAECSVGIIET